MGPHTGMMAVEKSDTSTRKERTVQTSDTSARKECTEPLAANEAEQAGKGSICSMRSQAAARSMFALHRPVS